MTYSAPRPTTPRAPALAAGALPRVVVLAGSTAGAGTSTTAAILAASVAALGRPVHRAEAGAATAAPTDDTLYVLDAGSRLDAVRTALTGNPDALLLVVTGAVAPALAAAFALVKATAPAAVEVVVVGAESAEASAAFARLDEGARHFLGRPLRLAAAVPDDPSLAVALAAGMSVHDAAAGSPAAAAIAALAERAARPAAPPAAPRPALPAAWASPRSAPALAPAFAR